MFFSRKYTIFFSSSRTLHCDRFSALPSAHFHSDWPFVHLLLRWCWWIRRCWQSRRTSKIQPWPTSSSLQLGRKRIGRRQQWIGQIPSSLNWRKGRTTMCWEHRWFGQCTESTKFTHNSGWQQTHQCGVRFSDKTVLDSAQQLNVEIVDILQIPCISDSASASTVRQRQTILFNVSIYFMFN